MTRAQATTPIFEYITVSLTDGHTDALSVTDRVITALERESQFHAAGAFLRTAEECETDDDVLALAQALVTVIQ